MPLCFPALLALLSAPPTAAGAPATYYVDDRAGDDDAAGTTPDTAWRTLDRVNRAALRPGERVLFRRGGLWRGSLRPVSGEPGRPVTYAAWGTGPKPILQGSTPRDAAADWVAEGPGLWATAPVAYTALNQLADLREGDWSVHTEAGARVSLTVTDAPVRRVTLVGAAPGTATNHIQLWGPAVGATLPELLLLRLRWRCSAEFRPGALTIRRAGAPWTTYATTAGDPAAPPGEWTAVELPLERVAAGENARLHLALGGRLPAGATFEIEPLGLWAATCNQPTRLAVDVGNIIFDHGVACGVKKWSREALRQAGDYYYDAPAQRVWLRSERHPAEVYRSVELALKRHVIDQGGRRDVTYENLHLRYGAAHGIGGGGTARITVRACDLSYIGGAHQFTTPEGRPVRYGNGIEFWGAARDSLVEGCRLWEIYDAALTNQGSSADSHQLDLVYRDNVVWNSEYSFEYWNRPGEAITRGIVFERNTCVDAGFGWAHDQRPDRNGGHLMFYSNSAATSDFVVRDNIFCNSTEVCLRFENDWRAGLTLDRNLWHQPTGPLVRWLIKTYFAAGDLAGWRQTSGLDANSLAAAPRFVDAARRDYRLAPGSPGLTLAGDGGPVGSRWTFTGPPGQ